MIAGGEVVFRRTWPQRFVLLACVGVIGAAVIAAWFVQTLYDGLAEVGRVEISGDVLVTETEPGEAVNFLLVGTDSAEGIDLDDPIHIGRIKDPRGRHNADSISVLRVDPRSGQAWVMSIPRDLYVDIPDAAPNKINAALLIGGPELLIKTVSQTFGIEINHYVVLDFLAFREVVDKLGGVPVWFEHETRSEATGLSILSPGCNVLDGVDALRYVRARVDYQEFIDGEWVTTQARDFERVERQQNFLVLTLDRAIQRGARSPRTLATLIEAGARSVELDQALTVAELGELGRSFSAFDPETLERFTPEVSTETRPDGSYIGEVLIEGANENMFAIFRGVADGLTPKDVGFDLYASDPAVIDGDGDLLAQQGFEIGRDDSLTRPVGRSVVIHPPGDRAAAVLVARYLIPIPAVVEDPGASQMTLVLGEEHEQVTFLFPHPLNDVLDAIDEQGDIEIPEIDSAVGSSTETTPTPTSVLPSTPIEDAPTTASGIRGRPPAGESCD